MVTREISAINYYYLHFEDINTGQEIYQSVTSRNLRTLRYYVKKLMQRRNLILLDFLEVSISADCAIITKFYVRYRDIRFHPKMYFYAVDGIWAYLEDIILGLPIEYMFENRMRRMLQE